MTQIAVPSGAVFSSVLSQYPQILEMLIGNTYGKIWMVGGGVVRILMDNIRNPEYRHRMDYWNLYSMGHFPFRDFDFIVEEFRTDFKFASGWEKKVNKFGGIKLLRKSLFREQVVTIDIWKLRKHDPCRRHNLPYTIENVLHLVPLTIQSIAVDLKEGRVIGDSALKAVHTRTVSVHNLEEAQNYARVYGVTIESYVTKKAKEYNFTPIL